MQPPIRCSHRAVRLCARQLLATRDPAGVAPRLEQLTMTITRRFTPLMLGFLLAGCASVTPIGRLLDDAGRYDGKTVRVRGEVQESAGVLGRGGYVLKDETGTLTVLSENAPPRAGSTVGVKGTFQSLFTIGSRSLAVLREQSRFGP